MLLQFTVENYMSIREKAFLSLEPATSDKEHLDNIISDDAGSALKSVAIYGANAAGKSNLFKAMVAALVTIRTSNARQITDKMPMMIPFKFDSQSSLQPCKFEFMFVADDGLKYVYGFSADSNQVYDEYLYRYTSAKPSCIFERSGGNHFDFTGEKKILQPLVDRNTNNKLFIATATAWNYDKTTVAYKWLAEQIDVFSDFEGTFGAVLGMYAEDERNQLMDFTVKLLNEADINIDSYSVEVSDNDAARDNPIIAALLKSNLLPDTPQKQVKIQTVHTLHKGEQNERTYPLDLSEESQGTKQLFMLSPILKDVFEKGKVIAVDELDRSLHPFLVKYIVDLFLNPEVNKNGAQLIFSTHDTNLLTLDIFRRDEIYFVEKNPATAETSVYSLDEFSVRKTENIEKGYLLGRYGAIPFLRTGGIV